MSLADGPNGSGGKSASFVAQRLRAIYARAELDDPKALAQIRAIEDAAKMGDERAKVALQALAIYHSVKTGKTDAHGARAVVGRSNRAASFGAMPLTMRPGVVFGARSHDRFSGQKLSDAQALSLKHLMLQALAAPPGASAPHDDDIYTSARPTASSDAPARRLTATSIPSGKFAVTRPKNFTSPTTTPGLSRSSQMNVHFNF